MLRCTCTAELRPEILCGDSSLECPASARLREHSSTELKRYGPRCSYKPLGELVRELRGFNEFGMISE